MTTTPSTPKTTPQAVEENFRYWAFISYSHRDEAFCSWLHRALEGYKTPPSLIGQKSWRGGYAIPKKLYPVFRDREELAAGASLNDALTSALHSARYLIVICSPNSAKSHWVNEEVRYFESLGREKYILPIILDGEPNDPEGKRECFPPALRAPKEPIAADAREGKDGKEAALMKLRAGLLGVRLEDLVNRELQRQERDARRNMLIAVFMLLLAMLALAGGWLAWKEKKEAELQKKESQHNYGLALAEKADRAFADMNVNEGQIYAAHALARIDWERDADVDVIRLSTLGMRLGQTGIPVTIQSTEKHNYTKSEAMSLDRKMRASMDGKTVKLWDVETGNQIVQLVGHEGFVLNVSFAANGKMLASGGGDKSIRLWDIETGNQIAQLLGHEGSVFDVSFSPDGKILASAGADKTVRLWDVAQKKPIAQLRGHVSSVLSVSFSADGKTLTSGSEDGVVRLWDVTAVQLVPPEGYKGYKSPKDETVSPDGKICVSLEKDGRTVRLSDVVSGKPFSQLQVKGEENAFTTVSFSRNGQILASGGGDKTVRLWDIAKGKELILLKGHEDWVNSVSFSPDGKILASWSEDKTVRLWDVATGKQLALLRGHDDWVINTFFSPDGQTLVSKDWRNNVKRWSLQDIYVRDWAAQAAQDEKRYGFKLQNFKLVPLYSVATQETK